MATLQNDKQSVKYVNDLLAANNPVSLIAALNSEGIQIPSGTTEIILSQLLDSIFNNEKDKWVRIVKKTQFNSNANNWTTSQQSIDALKSVSNASSDPNAKFSLSGILTNVGDFFGGSSTTSGGSDSSTNIVTPTVAAIVLVVFAAIIGVIIWKS